MAQKHITIKHLKPCSFAWIFILCLFFIAMSAHSVFSEILFPKNKMSVNWVGDNLYETADKDMLILTKNCFIHVYYAEAAINKEGGSGVIAFEGEAKPCEIKEIFMRDDFAPGRYELVSGGNDGVAPGELIAVRNKNAYVKTRECGRASEKTADYLKMFSKKIGVVRFKDGSSCKVDGVFKRLSSGR